MIKILVKNRLSALFGTAVSKGRDGAVKAGKGRILLFSLLYLLLISLFAGMSVIGAVTLGFVLIPIGASWLYFAIFFLVSFTLIFVLSIFETKSELFECKDNDLLLSMPIKPRDIVASRVLVVLIYNYVESLIIMLPAIIVYGVISGDVVGIFGSILVSLLIPLLATSLSAFCGYGVAMLSRKVKKKTLVSVIFYVIFLGFYMFGYEALFSGLEKFIADTEAAGSVEYIPILYYIGAAALFNPISFITVVLVSFASALITYSLISRSYIRIVTSRFAPRLLYKERNEKSRSCISSLVRKEISRFFSSATYIMNGGLGYLFTVALGVFLIVKSDSMIAIAEEIFAGYADPIATLIPLLVGAIIFISSICMISASSVSLEGKSLWIIKTMPIDSRTVLLAKALSQFIISTPPTLLASLLLIIATDAGVEFWAFIIIIPIIVNAFYSLFGTVINTAFPKFDWANETEVIKQSLSVFIVMFGGMIIALLAYAATFALTIFVDPIIALITLFALYSGLDILLYNILIKDSARRFDKTNV